ncbi:MULTISPECIES: hypothetical protein [Rhizobium/Agrobacterium group]|nr:MULTISPECIES: hypothetical protein [Rhizobium/Agrobacterium group]
MTKISPFSFSGAGAFLFFDDLFSVVCLSSSVPDFLCEATL